MAVIANSNLKEGSEKGKAKKLRPDREKLIGGCLELPALCQLPESCCDRLV